MERYGFNGSQRRCMAQIFRNVYYINLLIVLCLAFSATYSFALSIPGSITYPSTDSDGNFMISWSSVSGATSYMLWRSQDSDFSSATTVYDGSNTSYSETDLADGTYYYRVLANNDCDASDWRTGSAVIVGNVLPDRPTGLTAQTGSNSGEIDLNWTATSGATGYVIVYDEDSVNPPWDPSQNGSPSSGSNVGNVTSATIKDLTPGQTYNFAVFANNASGDGLQSSAVSATASYSVTIQSHPQYAEVYLGDNFIGIAPQTIKGLGGHYHVFLKMAGYQDREILVDPDDAGTSFNFQLQKSSFPEWEEKNYSWISSYPVNISSFSESDVESTTNEKLDWLILEAEKKATGEAIKRVITYFASKSAAKIGGIVFSIIQQTPTVGYPSDRAVILMADGQNMNTNLIVNKEYIILYIYSPGDWLNPPREINIEKAIFCTSYLKIILVVLMNTQVEAIQESFQHDIHTLQPAAYNFEARQTTAQPSIFADIDEVYVHLEYASFFG